MSNLLAFVKQEIGRRLSAPIATYLEVTGRADRPEPGDVERLVDAMEKLRWDSDTLRVDLLAIGDKRRLELQLSEARDRLAAARAARQEAQDQWAAAARAKPESYRRTVPGGDGNLIERGTTAAELGAMRELREADEVIEAKEREVKEFQKRLRALRVAYQGPLQFDWSSLND
jgi:hypothetical protein